VKKSNSAYVVFIYAVYGFAITWLISFLLFAFTAHGSTPHSKPKLTKECAQCMVKVSQCMQFASQSQDQEIAGALADLCVTDLVKCSKANACKDRN
jgi:hypothetical protein